MLCKSIAQLIKKNLWIGVYYTTKLFVNYKMACLINAYLTLTLMFMSSMRDKGA